MAAATEPTAPAPAAPGAPEFPPVYDPHAHEDRIYARWDAAQAFHADPHSDARPYTIVIPPPNVTGALHIGHALNNSLQDLLIRFRRMQGYETLWMPGTDHAGIATQNVVEKHLKELEGHNRYHYGRDELIRRIWEWKEKFGGTILKQLRKLGASCDWARTRFTMDEGLSTAVREAFVRLYEQGLIYRGKYLVNWCPQDRTTLSDDEVNHKEVQGNLYEIHYPLADDPRVRLTVATTRPETMLGDTAVAVNPKDPRYQAYVGKLVRLPLTEREIPVIADEAVDFEFGTGCLKVTPAHDPVDYEIGRRHGLELISILDEKGCVNAHAPAAFQGLERFVARKAVIKALDAQGLLGEVKPHLQQVGHSYRSGAMIEPMLTSQWFVSMKRLSELAVKASEEERVVFQPDRWTKVYLHWFKDVRDWPISRQIWWGHQIPVWYCLEDNPDAIVRLEAKEDEPFDLEEGGKCYRFIIGEHAKPIVSREDPATRPEFQGKTLIRDPDVLDTWFSSGLWPFSTLGWPEQTPELVKFYPTSTLVTGRDIIYFWVARMVMLGEFLMGREPYHTVVINGTVQDGDGAVMSKSKGNGVDPLDIIQRYGADALRFTLYDLSTEGQDVKLPIQIVCPHCGQANPLPAKRNQHEMECSACKQVFQQPVPNKGPLTGPDAKPLGSLDSARFEKGRNFANKVWNAARFLLTSIQPEDLREIRSNDLERGLLEQDRWILSRLNRAIKEVTEALDGFHFSRASNALYRFFWNEFCAWTIELSKPRLGPEADPAERHRAAAVLVHVMDRSLKLLHPFCPFLSEVLWERLAELAPTPEQRNLGYPAHERLGAGGKKLPEAGALLCLSAWPSAAERWIDPELEQAFESVFEAVAAVRNIRMNHARAKGSSFGFAANEKLKVFIRTTEPAVATRLNAQRHILFQMALLEEMEIGPEVAEPKPAAKEVLAGAELFVSLAGRVDLDKERQRLEAEIARVEKAVQAGEKKLGNAKFVEHAPPDVVAAERQRLDEYRAKVASLRAGLAELGA